MKPPPEWTWVHYKVLEGSFDCCNLPELLQEWRYIGFGDQETHIPVTSREESEAAVLDLLAVGAIDIFDEDGRLEGDAAVRVVRADSSWTYDERGAEIEVVENAESGEFLRNRPKHRNPHVPGTPRSSDRHS